MPITTQLQHTTAHRRSAAVQRANASYQTTLFTPSASPLQPQSDTVRISARRAFQEALHGYGQLIDLRSSRQRRTHGAIDPGLHPLGIDLVDLDWLIGAGRCFVADPDLPERQCLGTAGGGTAARRRTCGDGCGRRIRGLGRSRTAARSLITRAAAGAGLVAGPFRGETGLCLSFGPLSL